VVLVAGVDVVNCRVAAQVDAAAHAGQATAEAAVVARPDRLLPRGARVGRRAVVEVVGAALPGAVGAAAVVRVDVFGRQLADDVVVAGAGSVLVGRDVVALGVADPSRVRLRAVGVLPDVDDVAIPFGAVGVVPVAGAIPHAAANGR